MTIYLDPSEFFFNGLTSNLTSSANSSNSDFISLSKPLMSIKSYKGPKSNP